MARREVIVEEMTPDEICWERYGVAKAGLLHEVRLEARRIRRQRRLDEERETCRYQTQHSQRHS